MDYDRQQVGGAGLAGANDRAVGQNRLVAPARDIHAVFVNGMKIRKENTDMVAPDNVLPSRVLCHSQVI